MAPAGAHALYVLEPTPNLDGRLDWTDVRPKARDDLYRHLERLGYPTDIVVEELVDPLDWERQGMERGTPFALSHRFRQTGPFRPGNLERRAPGLVFTGSGTVPGVGVPMVLVSGMLAAAAGRGAGTPMMTTLDESYARCRGLNKRYGTTYYWSTFVLPPVKRHHVWALYAFCRHADDIVDDLGPTTIEVRREGLGSLRASGSSPTSTPAPPTTRCSRPWCTPCEPSTSTRTASAGSCTPWRWTSPSPTTPPGTTCATTWTARPPSSAR